jgi:hypothetical protein
MYFISILALGTISSVLAKTFNPIEDLGPQLSAGATIAIGNSSAPRWSEYAAPQPGYTVNVADELDVAKTVRVMATLSYNVYSR